jgi:hypothetical protein
MVDELPNRDEWRIRPWAIALLIILAAIAFGVPLAMVGLAVLTVAAVVVIASWAALIVLAFRKRSSEPMAVEREVGP